MPVFIIAFLTLSGLAMPAMACTPNGGSTFCADGWITAPVSRSRPESPDQGGDPESLDNGAMLSDGDVWVDGAMPVDAGPSPDDGDL